MRDRATIGGNYSAVLAGALARSGLDVELWSCVTSHELAPCDVPIVQVWRPGAFAWLDILRAFLRRRPAVVHVQHYAFLLGSGASGELSTLALVLVLALVGARTVVTLHDVPGRAQITTAYARAHNYRYPAKFIRFAVGVLFRAIGMASRVVIVHEEPFADRAAAFGVPRSKVRVVPHMALPANPIDRATARRALGLGDDERVVLFFGYATRYKGIENLLEAFALLRERGSDVRLLLAAGEHPKIYQEPEYRAYYARLRSRADELANVTFLGFVPDDLLGARICAADLGIVPYVESHGASGPMNYFLTYDRPLLVSEQVAEHAPELAPVAFATSPATIADAVAGFFDGSTGDAVRARCAELRASLLAVEYVELTEAAYAEARGR
jgi:glycosyltransferase involved in cell wall biosynthesis